MLLKLGTDDIYDCPEGKFNGVVERIGPPKTPIKKPCPDQIRMTIRVKTPKGEKLVARTFCADLSYGSEFYNFLSSWLEDNFDEYLDANGVIDTDLFIGKAVGVLVKHRDKGTHEKPFVHVVMIFPLCTLEEEE